MLSCAEQEQMWSKHEDALRKIHADLLKRHSGHILRQRDLQWVFTNVGGYRMSTCIVHSSMTESVSFSWSPVQAMGHAGWHWSNASLTLVAGSMKVWPQGSTKVVSFKPGDTVRHSWGTSVGTEMSAGTWLVGYHRGFIPCTLAHALTDALFNTHDFSTAFHAIRAYVRAMHLEVSHYIAQPQEFARKQFS